MAGYTRQSTASIINGENITAPPLTAEFNQLAAAFNLSSGHSHDGTTGNAPKIELSTSATGFLPINSGGTGGRNNFSATRVPGVGDDTADGYAVGSVWYFIADDRYFVCMYAASGAAVWLENRFINSNGDFRPHDGEVADLGSAAHKWRDALLSRDVDVGRNLNVTTNTGVGGTLVVTGATTLAATSATSLNVSGTATLAAVDINNGNIDNTQIGAANPSTGAFTSLSASGTSTLTTVDINNGTIDNTVIGGSSAAPASFTTISATGNITGNLVGNVTGNITASGSSTLNNLTVNGTMDVTNTQIANVSTPTNASHAANKSYVDAQINNLIGGAPSTLDTLNEIADALNDDANVYNTLDTKIDTKLSKAGDTMSGDLAMGANKVTGLATPTTGTDAVNLTYVTNLFGSTSSAASSASAAATSESSAASSATAAAASYDSFDDRYIGPKTGTLPSVDNDGNALVVGALVFDATNNVMKVWNGSEFQAASSSIDGIKSNFKYTATANQTSFLGADANGNTLVIDNADLVNVFMNGVRLIGGGSDYTASANVNTVTLTAGATASDVIEIEVFGNFTGQAGSAVSITGGTVSGLTSLGVAGDATFGDNNKAIFGTNSELEIFSNGTQALVKANAGHDLILRSNDTIKLEQTTGSTSMIEAVADGAVNLFHDGTQRLATSSTGIDVTGTVTADGLTVDGNATISSYSPTLVLEDTDGAAQDDARLQVGASVFNIKRDSDNLSRLTVGLSTGDISFFDTSGNAKFFWDASASALGIGTNSPSHLLDVEGSGDASIRIGSTGSGDADAFIHIDGGDTGESAVYFETDGVGGAFISMTGGAGGDLNIATEASSGRNIDLQPHNILTMRVVTPASGTNTTNIVEFFADSTSAGKISALDGDLVIGEDAVGIKFENTGTDRIIPVNVDTLATRSAAIDLGGSAELFKDLWLSGGVYLGGTGSANKISDYETGTWTPFYHGGTGNPTCTYDIQSGYYTKVGRQVNCHGRIRTDAVSGGSGILSIGGLPFTAMNVNGNGSGGTVTIGSRLTFKSGEFGPEIGYVTEQTTTALLRYFSGTNTAGNCEVAALDNTGNDNDIMFSISYITTE